MNEDLAKIRIAFEQMDRTDLPVTFQNFPRGACGDTCDILAELLTELGYGNFQHVSGCREDNYSHAWLEQDGVVIDITADQFDEISEPIYFGEMTKWYQQFEIQIKKKAGYSLLDRNSVEELSEVHLIIKSKLNGLKRTFLWR